MSEVIKCISEWQPWGTAIVRGRKKWETRSWPAPKWAIGKSILIHAAKQPFKLSDYSFDRDFLEELKLSGIIDLIDSRRLPYGALLGSVVIEGSVPTEKIRDVLSLREKGWGNYDNGRHAWQLSCAVEFPEPIQFKGSQGFFDVDASVIPAGWMR